MKTVEEVAGYFCIDQGFLDFDFEPVKDCVKSFIAGAEWQASQQQEGGEFITNEELTAISKKVRHMEKTIENLKEQVETKDLIIKEFKRFIQAEKS